jgi:hypothetical protein
VISYSPLLSLVYVRYFAYNADGVGWSMWLAGYPTLFAVWGSIILVLLVLHLWCDACFGVRFSNLTNRGIITNGPYRFSKHPAYVIKNIRWWMVTRMRESRIYAALVCRRTHALTRPDLYRIWALDGAPWNSTIPRKMVPDLLVRMEIGVLAGKGNYHYTTLTWLWGGRRLL